MLFFLIWAYRTGGTKMFIFGIVCADVVYLPGEKLSLFTHFCSNQRFS